MDKRLPKLAGAIVLALLTLSFIAAAPAYAACAKNAAECIAPPYAVPAEPVWATLDAGSQGNYPGGNETFHVFVINSDHPPAGNVTLINETLTAAAFPPASQSKSATGLPVRLSPGQAITNTISLKIPSDFSQNNFTADLAAYVQYFNGTTYINLKLTGTSLVFILGPPIASTQTTGSSTGTGTTQSTQNGTVSASLFEAGVATPSIIAVILLALVARRRGGPKGSL